MRRYREYGLVSTEGATPRHLASVIWRGLGADVGLGWPGQVLAASSVAAVAWTLVASARRPAAREPPSRPASLRPGGARRRRLRALRLPACTSASRPCRGTRSRSSPSWPPVWRRRSRAARPPSASGASSWSDSCLACVAPKAFAYLGLRQTNVDVAAAAVAARRSPRTWWSSAPGSWPFPSTATTTARRRGRRSLLSRTPVSTAWTCWAARPQGRGPGRRAGRPGREHPPGRPPGLLGGPSSGLGRAGSPATAPAAGACHRRRSGALRRQLDAAGRPGPAAARRRDGAPGPRRPPRRRNATSGWGPGS